jgi:hypothetical protein
MTMHPLVRLVANEPRLLAEHAQGYAELLAAEFGQVSAIWKRRALLNAIALCCLGVAAILAGVALMLWAVSPAAAIRAPWALLVAPLIPCAVALGCLALDRVAGGTAAFASVRQQVQADLVMLRQADAA